MDFEIVDLDEVYVAGLAVRTDNETEQKLAGGGWIATTWEEVRSMSDPNLPAAVYTGYASDRNGRFTVVIGFRRSSLNDLKAGEVITKVPSGKYAKFTLRGVLPNVVIEAWQSVWRAEEEGKLKRSYTADLELYSGMSEGGIEKEMTVELYIAMK
ncbi:MAG TPA: GyrI-like domain-containing protein [Pyrinomonadaceae bacterium]|jgi:predicted transcriptional regulator YdeE|nr:GyrI-like domain-containing protein [Pyrinomonadaceae bacterium]